MNMAKSKSVQTQVSRGLDIDNNNALSGGSCYREVHGQLLSDWDNVKGVLWG